jgi:hypothetical protein
MSYRQILAKIALDHHKSGGADINAEVARRFLAGGDVTSGVPDALPPGAGSDMPDSGPGAEPATGPSPVAKFLAPGQDPNGPPPVGATGQNPDGSWIMPEAAAEPATAEADHSGQPGAKEPTVTGDHIEPPAPAKPKPVSRGTGPARQPQPDATSQSEDAIQRQQDQGVDLQTAEAGQEGDAKAAAIQAATRDAQAERNADIAFRKELDDRNLRLGQEQDNMIHEYANASVDPKRYWNSLDTGHKILAGLSLVLSGNGDGSPVIRAINTDIDNQKEQIERTGKAAGMLGTLMERYSSMGLNHVQAMEHSVATAKLIADEQVDGMTQKFAGVRATAAVPILKANNAQNRINAQNTNMKTAAEIQAQKAAAGESYARTRGQNLQNELSQATNDYWRKQGLLGVPHEGMVTGPNGEEGYSLGGAAGAKIFNDESGPAVQADKAMKAIQELRKPGVIANAFNQKALKQAGEDLGSAVLQMQGLKDKPNSAEIVKHFTGDASELVPGLGGDWEKQYVPGLTRMIQNHIDLATQHGNVQFRPDPAAAARALRRPMLPGTEKKRRG